MTDADPRWWDRSPAMGADDPVTAYELCSFCGHTRDLHGGGHCRASGCTCFSSPNTRTGWKRPVVVNRDGTIYVPRERL
jgi:hypothetical protein